MPDEEAVIVATARSAIGRANKGSLVDYRADELMATILNALMDKVPEVDRADIFDIICGNVAQSGETGFSIARTAGAIDPISRTLLTELQIPNKDGTLYAGMYGEVQFTLQDTANAPLMVTANAYIFRTAGPQVVLVRNGKIHWQTITVGRDYGTQLEALAGLSNGDQVVVNPSDSLEESMQVKTQPQ